MSRSKWGRLVFVVVFGGCGRVCTFVWPPVIPRIKIKTTRSPRSQLAPDQYKSSGDPDDNIMSLLKEKLETLRQREDFVKKGFAAGKKTQRERR